MMAACEESEGGGQDVSPCSTIAADCVGAQEKACRADAGQGGRTRSAKLAGLPKLDLATAASARPLERLEEECRRTDGRVGVAESLGDRDSEAALLRVEKVEVSSHSLDDWAQNWRKGDARCRQ